MPDLSMAQEFLETIQCRKSYFRPAKAVAMMLTSRFFFAMLLWTAVP